MTTIQDLIDHLNKEAEKAERDRAWHAQEGHQEWADYYGGIHDGLMTAVWFIIGNCQLTKEGE